MIVDWLKLLEEHGEVKTKVLNNICDGFAQVDCLNLNIIHFNIRSIRKNFDELLVYLEERIKYIDIIVLSETWIIDSVSDFRIPNFDCHYNKSKTNQNDGLIVYIRNNIAVETNIQELTDTNLLNISFKINNTTVGITASYRLPSTDTQLYITELAQYLDSKNKNQIDIFLGDININLLNYNFLEVNNYLNILAKNGYICYINEPTRITSNSKSIIDHIFVHKRNSINQKVNINSMIFETDLTDHFSTGITFDFNEKNINDSNTEKIQKKINYQKLNNFLEKEKWEQVLNCKDVQESYNIFINTLILYINKATKTINIHNNKVRKIKPWITIGLINSIKHRDNLKKKLLKNYSNELKLEYTEYRNLLNKLIKNTKNQYYKNELESANGNYKRIWEIINEASNSKTKKDKLINVDILNDKGELTNDAQQKANIFNDYFINIGKKMAQKIEKNTDLPGSIYTDKYISSTVFLTPVTDNEIILFISKLKNRSAAGPDNITSDLIKAVHGNLIKPLKYLINLVFKIGILPAQWKESIVTPVLKAGDPSNPNNYRPISLINSFAKIFEQAIKNRLTSFFSSFSVLTDRQFGFRKETSTEHAVIDLIKKVVQNIDNDKKCVSVFLDLAKAFDTVSHGNLLDRLEQSGVRGPALNVLRNYLSDRIQKVRINNVLSEPSIINMGVPQGTVLGPILFLVYINLISNLCNFDGHIVSYADDTAIVFEGDSWDSALHKAEKGLISIYKWLNYSVLSLNTEKTKFMTFTLLSDDQPNKKNIFIHNNSCHNHQNCTCPHISKVSKIKYLGVMLDHHLRWDEQITYINKRLRQLINKFYCLREILNLKNLRIVYNALVESIIRYCILAWGGLFQNNLHNLQVTQNMLIKIILKKNSLYSTEALYSESGIFDVKKLYIYQCLIWAFKSRNFLESYSSHNTRNVQNQSLKIPLFKKTHTQRFVFYFGPKFYNILPPCIKNISSIKRFKKEIKKFIATNKKIFDKIG